MCKEKGRRKESTKRVEDGTQLTWEHPLEAQHIMLSFSTPHIKILCFNKHIKLTKPFSIFKQNYYFSPYFSSANSTE